MNRNANASAKSKELQPQHTSQQSCSTFVFALTHKTLLRIDAI